MSQRKCLVGLTFEVTVEVEGDTRAARNTAGAKKAIEVTEAWFNQTPLPPGTVIVGHYVDRIEAEPGEPQE